MVALGQRLLAINLGPAEALLVAGLLVALAVYVAIDLNRAGRFGPGWALLVIVAPPVGVIAWLLLRRPRGDAAR